jgi:hypothetical protein
MPTNDIADPPVPTVEPPPFLRSRTARIKRTLRDAKQRLDLHALIVKHPLPAVGLAFALGAAAGGRRRAAVAAVTVDSRRSLRSAAFTGFAAIGLHIVREMALGRLRQVVRQWLAETDGGPSAPVDLGRVDELEAFSADEATPVR